MTRYEILLGKAPPPRPAVREMVGLPIEAHNMPLQLMSMEELSDLYIAPAARALARQIDADTTNAHHEYLLAQQNAQQNRQREYPVMRSYTS